MPMDSVAIAQIVVLLMLANGAPVIGKLILGDRWATPVDFGLVMRDGHRLFGRSKTVRGILFAIVVTSVAAPLIGLDWLDGLVIATAAMIGDLASSFLKRRLGMESSSRATGLDQIPESLLPALAAQSRLGLSYPDVAIVVLVFFVGEVALSRILYRLKLRERPY